MKKRLFEGDRETYTVDGVSLSYEIQTIIDPIIKKYADMGFSLRDIEYIIYSEVKDAVLGLLIDIAGKKT